MPMVGLTVAAYAAPGDGTSGPPAPPGSPADPHDPGRTQAPRTPTASPSRSNTMPTAPTDPKCAGMELYPTCEGGSLSRPRNPEVPADPGRTRAPRRPTSTPPTRTSSPPAPSNPSM